ncbi:MAG TPA: PAS domain-containing protein, partial [Segetibacter sp.]
PAWKELTGYTPEETLGNTFIQYVNDDHVLFFWEELNNLLAGSKNNFDRQIKLVDASGEKIWVRILAEVIYGDNNSFHGFFGSIENIHNKYNEQLLLRESSERTNAILNNSKEIILTINLENNVIANVNDAVSILGYQPEEWINTSYKSWKHDKRNKFHELIKLAVESELKVQNQQIYFPNKSNSEIIPFEFSTSIFHIKNNKYLLCVLRDIRERIKYEENISLISKQLTHLLNNIDDVYAIFDLTTGRYDFVSDNVEALYGCSKDSYCNDTLLWRNCINKEDVAAVEKEVGEIITNVSRGEISYRINTCLGERKTLREKLFVGKDNEGKAEKLYVIKTDFTNIENAEQSRLETERKFRFISENLSDFISIHDTDWNFTYASPSIRNILGFEPDEVLGLGGLDLIHPDDLLRTLNDSLKPIVINKKETRFRYRMLSKNRSYKWVETYSKPVIDSKDEISSIISSTRDVTDQVIAENKLRESEEQYRLLSENSNDIIGIHNLRNEYIYVSPSCRQVLGYDQNELLGRSPKDVFLKKEEEDKKEEDEISEIKQERKFITRVITKSGEEKLLEVWVKPVFKDDQVVALQSASRDVTE